MQNTAHNPVWHTLSKEETLTKLETTVSGLTEAEAAKRLGQYGQNSLPEQTPDTWWRLAIGQFASPLVYVLLVVVAITFALGEYVDGSIISFVLLFNAIVGAYQEGKAQNAILALKSYEHETALVRRDGTEDVIPIQDIVPGDIIIVLEGNRIPADARLLQTESLSIDEAILTGESQTKTKDTQAIAEPSTVPGDRINMLFKGTFASRGKGTAVVVATGTTTEIGKLSKQVALYDTEIPLQRKIKKLTNTLVVAIGIGLVVLMAIAFLQGYALREIFLTAASLLVAVMPEGLPIVVTLVLAKGVQRMAKNNVLVKRLQAVEALGNADIIAVDKTGTLTRNELSVIQVLIHKTEYNISGVGYQPTGTITPDPKTEVDSCFMEFARYSMLSANAEIFRQDDAVKIAGDPTEAAMLVFGERAGQNKHDLLEEYPLLDEIAFSYKRKYYANLHGGNETNVMIVTGAPEVLLDLCSELKTDNGVRPIKDNVRKELLERVHEESARGRRVIAMAYDTTNADTISEDDVSELIFFGLFIMEDQIREAVPEAVQKARDAHIRVVMITGDYPSTAQSIATDAGIFTPGDRVLSGGEIEQMNDADLAETLPNTTVFARVTPEHKLRIIQGFRNLGKTIAMTGDGVNDVPSLVAADLGVAMGKIGTEAAKAAGDIVLLDDNFGNITAAVQEGKRIFRSIKKVITYLMSTNTGEVAVIAYAIIIGVTIPLNPVQIVWLNLLTDSFLVFPLASEKPKSEEKTKISGRKLLGWYEGGRIAVVALAMLGSYLIINTLYGNSTQPILSSLTLLTIVFGQIWTALTLRDVNTLKQVFRYYWFWIAVLAVLLLQIIGLYLPAAQTILRTTSLSMSDWSIAILASLTVPLADQIYRQITKFIHKG